MATTPNLPLSPTSTSSYDLVSSLSGSLSDRADVTSDDEVVWLPHGTSESSFDGSVISDTDDDDFVVLSRPRSPLRSIIRTSSEGTDSELSSAISGLSLRDMSTFLGFAARGIGIERPSSATTLGASMPKPSQPSPLGGGSPNSQKKTKAQKKSAKKARRTARGGSVTVPTFTVVDDAASDTGSTSTTSTVSGYEDAASFITSFLSSPESRNSVCKLTLLHSFIIELGLSTSLPSLPGSLKAAKALLKSQAHVNIKDYVAVREQGQDALRKVMHPSRSSLVKDIRKRGNRASLKWVKSQGLQVFLVSCFH